MSSPQFDISRVREALLSRRIYLLLVLHAAFAVLCWEFALQLRFDFAVPPRERAAFWHVLWWIVPLKLLVLHRLRSLHGWWRYITFADLASLAYATTVSTCMIACIDYFLISAYQIPRSVILIDWGVTILTLGGMRSIWRLLREHLLPSLTPDDRRCAFIIGGDQAGEFLARQINGRPELDTRVIGFLDENSKVHHMRLGGIPILGSPSDVVSLARSRDVDQVLVMTERLSGTSLRRLISQCEAANLAVKMIPPIAELLQGRQKLMIRDVNIDDLLRREPVRLDTAAIHKMLRGRRVMVTGAGGSIGSEICRQVAKCEPASLILVERAENSLFQIEREFYEKFPRVALLPRLGDVRDVGRMRQLFEQEQPEIVFHAAAHKHVPLIEMNPGEAIVNNVVGTQTIVDLADECGVAQFVMISTDKAVNPSSVMGMSKQIAERYVHAMAQQSGTKFVVVRFGNVLASNGSVVPIFQRQIAEGGPVTVTHPDMERYFMTIPEASQLVLQAAAMSSGGEIYVLDMGDPVKILDLANDLIRLSGFQPGEIAIEFTGMRSGEKLYESLHLDDEQVLPTPHEKVLVMRPCDYELQDVRRMIERLKMIVHAAPAEVRSRLESLMPRHSAVSTEASVADTIVASETIVTPRKLDPHVSPAASQ